MTYVEKRIKDGVVGYRREIVDNSMTFEGDPQTDLQGGATTAYISSRIGKSYLPEGQKRVLNTAQFGQIEPQSLFFCSCDFRPAELSHTQWRKLGFNRLSKWTSDQSDGSNQWVNVPDNQKFEYETESSLHGQYEGYGYFVASLSDLENYYQSHIPANPVGAMWTANIESSNLWWREAYRNDDGSGGWGSRWPRWIDVKNNSITLESTGETMTLEQLYANNGKQVQEEAVRRANRVTLMLMVAKRNGCLVAYGSAIYQGEPKTNALSTSNRFLDYADADVSHIGGNNGTIVLNGRTYTGFSGSFYKHETFHLDYHYYFDFTYSGGQNYNDVPDYPTLYPNIQNRHIIAREVGHWLAVQKRLKDVHGGNTIPVVRMHELFYEGNESRVPNAFNCPNGDGGQVKVWVPPYIMRSQRMLTHFLEGERYGSGYHIFHAAGSPNQGIEYNLSSNPKYNHHLHTLSTLIAAGRDMETILDKISGSTLTTDIDIKINNTGSFDNVNGVEAYALDADGGQGTLKPCFITRHKTTNEGLLVVIMGGMDQDWNTTRTDIIRIPGVGNGNTIKITYKGKDLQAFEVLFPTGVTNTEFLAQSIVGQWEKKGYGGRINNN